MGQTLIHGNAPSRIYSTSTTLRYAHWHQEWAIVADTGGITLTLPTPIYDVQGKVTVFSNTAGTSVTLSGAFIGGSSYTLAANTQVLVFAMKTAAGTYKWIALGDTSVSLTTEQVQDIVGAIVSGNTETGIAVTYDDPTGVLNFVVADEYLQDVASTMLTGGAHTNVTVTYHDDTGLMDLAATSGHTDEQVQDLVGAMFTSNTETGINITYQDGDGTIDAVVAYGAEPAAVSSSTSGTAGVNDTASRSDHSHDLGAHAHTGATDGGTVTAASVSDFAEVVADTVGAMFTGNTETGIAISYDDADNTIDAVVDAEWVADTVGAMFTGNTETGCSVAYDDADNTIDVAVTYGAIANTACQGNDTRLPFTTANALTGGAAGALDAIVTAGAATVGAEEVVVTLGAAPNQTFSRYRFEKTGVAAESSPDVIRPDDFATDGQGNWNLVLVAGASQTYGTATDTACAGNDGRLPSANEKTALAALVGSVNCADWAPTWASVPAVDSQVNRITRIGNLVWASADIRGSDGDAWTPSTMTLGIAPADKNSRIPIKAEQIVAGAPAIDMGGYVDAETGLNVKFERAIACTNAAAWHIYVMAGPYEVAP